MANSANYKGHEIQVGEPRIERYGRRRRWYRTIYIDGKYVTYNQHKAAREAIKLAQRLIDLRPLETI